MPAQQGIGLHNEQALAPGAHTTGEQDQHGPVDARAARPLDAASQDDQLLSEEGILGDEFGLRTDKVSQRACTQAVGGRFRDHAQALPDTLCRGAADGKAATKQVDSAHGLSPHSSGRHRCRTPASHVYQLGAKVAAGRKCHVSA
jgi:hypothetical protein